MHECATAESMCCVHMLLLLLLMMMMMPRLQADFVYKEGDAMNEHQCMDALATAWLQRTMMLQCIFLVPALSWLPKWIFTVRSRLAATINKSVQPNACDASTCAAAADDDDTEASR